MAEVASQPAPRGRGSTRSRRGGHNPRGGGRSGSRQTNGHAESTGPNVSLDDQGELGLLKKKYMSDLSTLKELFPDWTDDDLVFALQETDGDLQSTIERITEGVIPQTHALILHCANGFAQAMFPDLPMSKRRRAKRSAPSKPRCRQQNRIQRPLPVAVVAVAVLRLGVADEVAGQKEAVEVPAAAAVVHQPLSMDLELLRQLSRQLPQARGTHLPQAVGTLQRPTTTVVGTSRAR